MSRFFCKTFTCIVRSLCNKEKRPMGDGDYVPIRPVGVMVGESSEKCPDFELKKDDDNHV